MRTAMLLIAGAALVIGPCLSWASPAKDSALAFMGHLCGQWIGTGIANGNKVTDELVVVLAPSRLALTATSRATAGDGFVSTTQLAFSPETGAFVSTESNNGRWPLRKFTGKLEGSSLNLHEVSGSRLVRLSISRLNDGTLRIEEALGQGQTWAEPFVTMNYRRASAAGECAA